MNLLTPRQLEVLALIAEGRSNPAIADLLCIQPKAVEKHVGAIFTRLGLYHGEGYDPRVVAALLYHRLAPQTFS